MPLTMPLTNKVTRKRKPFTMPAPPAPGLVACAYPVGPPDDVWHLYWAQPEETNEPADVEKPDIEWPFDPEYFARAVDMERLGFLIVD